MHPFTPFATPPHPPLHPLVARSYGFGTSVRHRPELQPKKTVYLGKDYERQNWGINSPGPAMYPAKQTIGPGAGVGQIRLSPSFSFGGEARF